VHGQTKTDFAQADYGWGPCVQEWLLPKQHPPLVRELGFSNYVVASQGWLPAERGPWREQMTKGGWSPQDTQPGFLLQTLGQRPSLSRGFFLTSEDSPRPHFQTFPKAMKTKKEAMHQPTLQNKARRTGYKQPPSCQTQTHKV
jgi:hypothetical protein